jgi:RNA 2',3'-cyclic 3'-phosphodiesterase
VPHPPTDTAARLFLALWPSSSIRNALLGCREAWTWPKTRSFVASQHLHLTLHFIGEVPRDQLLNVLTKVAVRFSRFNLCLDESQIWPRGVAVIQPTVVPPALLELHRSLSDALRRLTLPNEDRSFRPHVTLARRADGALAPEQTPQVLWRICEYALVESLPGPPYTYRVHRPYFTT